MMNKWIVAFFFLLNLTSSHASVDTLTLYLNKIKSQLMRAADPIPPLNRLSPFFYPKMHQNSDPFIAKLSRHKANAIFTKDKQLLKSSSVESIRYNGVLKQDSFLWAIISWPNGELSSVGLGGYLEKNNWKVIDIKEDSLLIEGKTLVTGQWIRQVKALHFG
ncbi:pilus assembly protein PilP [Legionella drozanskii]|uniref:Type IV pilus biogenesis protein PilP n=1 Tax=Legionella drozanskii LLAP-1 TaxID=1212489 RepID=A0A0W0SQK3_9GAMM|nr:pilus assembly protein PilP [Legionella drozanskii]KTC85663.1 type IV pilus biogenesis protein PilP [Legionella drozanskii LLAP-1]